MYMTSWWLFIVGGVIYVTSVLYLLFVIVDTIKKHITSFDFTVEHFLFAMIMAALSLVPVFNTIGAIATLIVYNQNVVLIKRKINSK